MTLLPLLVATSLALSDVGVRRPPRQAAFVRPLSCARARVAMDESPPPEPKRMSIKVTAPNELLAKLAPQCRMEAGIKRGLTGVVYGLGDKRLEIISEGTRIDKFVDWVNAYVQSECGGNDCEVATVLVRDLSDAPAMHSINFPVVNFNVADRQVTISLTGDRQVLDYTLRHTKIEASFNRKLTYTSEWQGDTQLKLVVNGPATQLKSFVRWCKRGPPLQRPDRVTIHWTELPTEGAQDMSTAFRDEGVMA
jgi:acylphosphatase